MYLYNIYIFSDWYEFRYFFQNKLLCDFLTFKTQQNNVN